MGIKAPRLDTPVVEPLSEGQLRALLKARQVPKGATPAEALRHRRDEAMLRLMLETVAPAGWRLFSHGVTVVAIATRRR
jgi:hypothetical protein